MTSINAEEPRSVMAMAVADRMLAEVASVDDAKELINMAEMARVYARQSKLGTSAINHATVIKLRAERKLADIVDQGQAAGEIATPADGAAGRRVGRGALLVTQQGAGNRGTVVLADPSRPPIGWACVRRSIDGAQYRRTLTDHSVILSVDTELDGRRWAHFSMAHPKRLPTWEELSAAKVQFLGAESKAIMVLAPRSEWVNIHSYCLHLFVCLDTDLLPDFTRGSGSL